MVALFYKKSVLRNKIGRIIEKRGEVCYNNNRRNRELVYEKQRRQKLHACRQNKRVLFIKEKYVDKIIYGGKSL